MRGTSARCGIIEGNGPRARVFCGKIAMPEEQMAAYLQTFEQLEHEKKPLRK